jgi:hypothetical protein
VPTADVSAPGGFPGIPTEKLRQGSNALDSSTSIERFSPVMLSAAKHLVAHRDRPLAEFTLSEANVLRVTLCNRSNGHGLCFTLEPCLNCIICVSCWLNLTAGLRKSCILTRLCARKQAFFLIVCEVCAHTPHTLSNECAAGALSCKMNSLFAP